MMQDKSYRDRKEKEMMNEKRKLKKLSCCSKAIAGCKI